MGRGLSELQKRIVLHAEAKSIGFRPEADWLDGLCSTAKIELRDKIIPGHGASWTKTQSVAVSRALSSSFAHSGDVPRAVRRVIFDRSFARGVAT
jgi:hypothetical protein